MKNGDLLGCIEIYPLVMSNIAIEHGPVEIVSFPMKHGWIFP
jgi:hypothetical protein